MYYTARDIQYIHSSATGQFRLHDGKKLKGSETLITVPHRTPLFHRSDDNTLRNRSVDWAEEFYHHDLISRGIIVPPELATVLITNQQIEFRTGDTVHYQPFANAAPFKGVVVHIQQGASGHGRHLSTDEPDYRLFYRLATPEAAAAAKQQGTRGNDINLHFTCTTPMSIVESRYFKLEE